MNIYSNSFFQRVKDWAVLKLNLEQGLKCFYCNEEVYLSKNNVGHIGIPMVSFSDIPLSHIATNNYGKCGLGMTRIWEKSGTLSCFVLPQRQKNLSTKMVANAYKSFEHDDKQDLSYRILGYAKTMKKTFYEKETFKDNYIEREWRKDYFVHSH